MPHQNSPSPAELPTINNPTASTYSLPRASPSAPLPSPSHRGPSHKPHRAHTGHGRLPHARNPSFGKNLNKLSKLTAIHGNEGNPTKPPTKFKSQTPSTSPSTQPVKRNSSNISLSRAGTKATVKKNSSNVSLKRNGSTAQIGKLTRPETPLRRVHPKPGNIDFQASKATVTFSVGSDEEGDDDGEDADWTEESRSHSQSPATTRRNSITRGSHEPNETPPEDTALNRAQVNLPDSPPQSPSTTASSEKETEQNNHQQDYYSSDYYPHPPDNDTVDSHHISRRPSNNLPPQISSASTGGISSQANTPPALDSQISTLTNPSMPEAGVSRFIQSMGSSASPNPTALTNLRTAANSQAPIPKNGTRSPSPEASTDAVRRAKSVGNLAPPANNASPVSSSPPSFTVGPQPKRPGGNTQAKLDLWRSRTHVEPSSGPPRTHITGFASNAILGMEERRSRLWENAEGEMGHLRRFRNPVLEGVGRVLGKGGKKERGRGERPGSAAGRVVGKKERERRGGATAGGTEEGEESERLQELLRRMWEGPVDN